MAVLLLTSAKPYLKGIFSLMLTSVKATKCKSRGSHYQTLILNYFTTRDLRVWPIHCTFKSVPLIGCGSLGPQASQGPHLHASPNELQLREFRQSEGFQMFITCEGKSVLSGSGSNAPRWKRHDRLTSLVPYF